MQVTKGHKRYAKIHKECGDQSSPVMYEYVRLRVGLDSKFTGRVIRFVPFAVYTLILFISFTFPGVTGGRNVEDLIALVLYEALFFHIFLFLLRCSRLILFNNDKRRDDVDRMRWTFLKVLVYSSLFLFATSWLGTHIFLLAKLEIALAFKSTIQVLVCMLLFVIALLNTESMYAKKLIKSAW